MSLDQRYSDLRDIVNDCHGYRILDDDDVIQEGDETVCGSTLLSGHEDWRAMSADDFGEFFGSTVAEMNNRAHNNEMDTEERLFRRKR